MADTTHSVRKTLRLTKAEAKAVAEGAAKAKMNEANYMRMLIMQKPSDAPERRQLGKDLINAYNRIGNNINQIARHFNTGLGRPDQAEQLLAYLRKLRDTTYEGVKKIGGD
jgi:hypothetical protein